MAKNEPKIAEVICIICGNQFTCDRDKCAVDVCLSCLTKAGGKFWKVWDEENGG